MSATPLPQWGGAPALPNFWSSLLFMHTPFDAELSNLTWQLTVETGLVFRGQSCSYSKGRCPSALKFWGFISIYAYTICYRTTKFDGVNNVGLFLGGQSRPTSKWTGPQRHPLAGFFLFMRTPFVTARSTTFDVVTHVGRGVYLGDRQASHRKRAEFQRSPIFGVLLYLCLHILT